jgi:hypothetical protein
MTIQELTVDLVGYQVRTADSTRVVGEVEGVSRRGMRLHKLPGHPASLSYLPVEAVETVDRPTNTIFLCAGIQPETIAAAPTPPADGPQGWRMSDDWWADLLGHYGLYEPEGRSSEPFLHPDQR